MEETGKIDLLHIPGIMSPESIFVEAIQGTLQRRIYSCYLAVQFCEAIFFPQQVQFVPLVMSYLSIY